jgi:hypothetical protein
LTNKNNNIKIKKKYEAYRHVKHQSPNRNEKRDPKIKYSFLLFNVKYLIVRYSKIANNGKNATVASWIL